MYTDRELKDATQVAYLSCLERIDCDTEKDKLILKNLDTKSCNWKIVDVCNKNSTNGFYACVIETSKSEAIIAFRGSENIKKSTNLRNDWLRADLGLLNSVKTEQQLQAEKYADYLIKSGKLDKYERIAITGHSLGGNLATHFTIISAISDRKELYNKIKQSMNFDGPGVSKEYLKYYEKEIRLVSDVINHYKWSAVGCLLYDIPNEHKKFLKINSRIHNKNNMDRLKYRLITRHSTESIIFDDRGMAIIGKQDLLSRILSIISKLIDKILPVKFTTKIFNIMNFIVDYKIHY